MKILRTRWVTFSLLSALSLFIWFQFTYPQFVFINLSVDRSQALTIAQKYLTAMRGNPNTFQTAVVFAADKGTDQYLQKSIGFKKLKEFVEDNDYDLFFWIVRFFKEGQKEEFRLNISSKTGQVTAFKHTIEDTAKRDFVSKEEAQRRVVDFLQKKFGFNLPDYTLKVDLQNSFDNRVEYAFSWSKNGINIPWSNREDDGTGKLFMGASISGDEIINFTKHSFLVPDKFNRFMEKERNLGRNLLTLVKIFYFILFIAATFFVIARRNHLAMHITKKFYITLAVIIFILLIASELNYYQILLFDYDTTSPFKDFLIRFWINTILNTLFVAVGFLLPALSGELLRYEVFPQKKEASFLNYILSTFFSRSVSASVLLGYLICLIMLGLQSVLTRLGEKYLGVWVEYSWMTQTTTAYLPFLAAFTIGFRASIAEELMYRLFAIHWGIKLFKNIFIAILTASLIWGFMHSGYSIYPMWFRGIEVTIIGLFLSWVYLRYGIIPVIIAHFLFDAFWSSAGYLLGHSKPFYFYTTIMTLTIPLLWSLMAFILNKSQKAKEMRWHLNKHQLYNIEILKNYLQAHQDRFHNKSKEEIKKEISSHGWDIAVVDVVLEDFNF